MRRIGRDKIATVLIAAVGIVSAAIIVVFSIWLGSVHVAEPETPDPPVEAELPVEDLTASSADAASGTVVTGGERKNDGIHTDNTRQRQRELEEIMKKISEETKGK